MFLSSPENRCARRTPHGSCWYSYERRSQTLECMKQKPRDAGCSEQVVKVNHFCSVQRPILLLGTILLHTVVGQQRGPPPRLFSRAKSSVLQSSSFCDRRSGYGPQSTRGGTCIAKDIPTLSKHCPERFERSPLVLTITMCPIVQTADLPRVFPMIACRAV